MYDYAGCIHFHSSYSYDARISIQEILASAARCELDYAIVTDHFRLDARQEGWEGYYHAPKKDVLLIVGEELSPRYNHYLALGIQKPIVVWKTQPNPQAMIDAVNAQGGFGFIAHPDHTGAPLVGARAYPWTHWNVTGFAGLSIWDLMGDWTSALGTRWSILRAVLFPSYSLRGPHAQTLARWDRLTQTTHCVAIGEIDNHAHLKNLLGFPRRLFPFDFAFRTIRTHVLLDYPLTGQAPQDQAVVLQALREGRSYVSLDLWNDARGFSFEIFDDARRVGIGNELQRKGPALLEVKVPVRGRISLIRDGRLIWEESKRSYIERDVDLPGVYRVQVDQWVAGQWRPWIFSNPIWVLEG